MSRDEAFVHQALLYRDEEHFRDTALPFLRRGLEADGAILAVVTERNLELLHREVDLVKDAKLLPAETFYTHPVQTIKKYHDIVYSTPKPVWALCEPVWLGMTPSQRNDWKHYESVVNAAFGPSNAQVICAYDTRRLPDDVLESASVTHPLVVEGQGQYHSHGYTDPERYATPLDLAPLPPPGTDQVALFPLGDELASLRGLRTFLADQAAVHGMVASHRLNAFLTAVTEVATNAIRHGAPPMEVRVWAEREQLICEVFDYGHWRPDALIGHVPREVGMGIGLWGVRLLADSLQIRTGWSGTTARLAFSRT